MYNKIGDIFMAKTYKKILGREEECRRLERCMDADNAQLVIVYGRRRVGKTFLINQFFENKFAFKITGIYGESREVQLKNFVTALKRSSGKNYDIPSDWYEAFELLREYIGKLPKRSKQVFFFVEMPWLDTHKSGFLSAFEWFWNDYAATMCLLYVVLQPHGWIKR